MTETIELIKPHPAQAQVLRERKRFNVLQCGRRFGKTTLGVRRAVKVAGSGRLFSWFAPTYKLMADPWRDVNRVLGPAIKKANEQEKRIELVTGGVIDFWTLDGEDPARGRQYNEAFIDEAGLVKDLEERWAAAIRPTLVDRKGEAWFAGTPKGRNYFHSLFMLGQNPDDPEWKSWRFRTVENPHIDADEVEAARRSMSAAVFAQEMEGIPADDGGNPFGISSIRNAIMPTGTQTGKPVFWGVDVAKSQDYFVVIGLDAEGRVAAFDRWQGLTWDHSIIRAKGMYGDGHVLVDATGVGDPIYERMAKESSRVEPFKFTSDTKQTIIEGLALAIQSGEIHYPAGVIVDELESFVFEYRGGRVRYEAAVGFHDDCVCALALAHSCRLRYGGVRYIAEWAGGKPPLTTSDEPLSQTFQRLRDDPDWGF